MTKTQSAPREGSTRIVRADEHNLAVEVFTKRTSKDGTERLEWVEKGYYGSNLKHACQSALYLSMPIGGIITPSVIREAVDSFMGVCNG